MELELLQAIGQMMDEKLTSVKAEMSAMMDEKLTSVKVEMSAMMDEKLTSVKVEMSAMMDEKLTSVKVEMSAMMDEKLAAQELRMDEKLAAQELRMDEKLAAHEGKIINQMNAIIETKVMPQIQLVAEQYEDVIAKLSSIQEAESVKGRVSTLERVVRTHTEEIAQLKKAQ